MKDLYSFQPKSYLIYAIRKDYFKQMVFGHQQCQTKYQIVDHQINDNKYISYFLQKRQKLNSISICPHIIYSQQSGAVS